MSGTPRTAGRLIADSLAAGGVRIAYTVPGESFLPLLDGLVAAGIRVIATRHEGGAAFMAAASAALSGHPTAVLGTRAVGAANLAIGLHVAHADSLPVIALVGQVERTTRGREGFQEVDLAATIGGYCRWAREVRDAAALPAVVDEALRRATSGRPGPVLLSLPEDLLAEEVAEGPTRATVAATAGPTRLPPPDPVHVRRILHLLLDAERPVILAGGGVLRSRATADLVRFAEFVDVPVVATWRRPDVFPNDNPRYLGMSGYFAAPTVRRRLEEADAILVIGSRLNEVASYRHEIPAAGTRWAHVDVEPLGSRAGLGAPTVALAADARTFLREARRVLATGVLDAAGLERRRAATAVDRSAYEDARRVDDGQWDGPGVHPGRIVATLNGVLSPDTIVTTDAGNFGGWAARGLILRRPGTFVGTTAGAMGFAIPAAIAASLAGPGRPVVALAGDGGAGMTIAELETAVREGVHPVVLVFDNERYGTIHEHQVQRGLARVATDLGPVDWVRVAEGFGAVGARIERDEEFEPALRAALAASVPTVIHLVVDRRWVSVDTIANAGTAILVAPRDLAPPAAVDETVGAEPGERDDRGLAPEPESAFAAGEREPEAEHAADEPEAEPTMGEVDAEPADEPEAVAEAEAAAGVELAPVEEPEAGVGVAPQPADEPVASEPEPADELPDPAGLTDEPATVEPEASDELEPVLSADEPDGQTLQPELEPEPTAAEPEPGTVDPEPESEAVQLERDVLLEPAQAPEPDLVPGAPEAP